MVIAIDFDGTIHDIDHPVIGRTMGPPMPGAVEALNRLDQRGHTLIVFTVRGDKPYVRDWLSYWKFPPMAITNVKSGEFQLIIDDRAIRYTGRENEWLQLARDLGA
jgi:hypothetical protein